MTSFPGVIRSSQPSQSEDDMRRVEGLRPPELLRGVWCQRDSRSGWCLNLRPSFCVIKAFKDH